MISVVATQKNLIFDKSKNVFFIKKGSVFIRIYVKTTLKDFAVFVNWEIYDKHFFRAPINENVSQAFFCTEMNPDTIHFSYKDFTCS